MLEPELIEMGALLLGCLAIGAIVYTLLFPYISGAKQTEKRLQTVTEGRAKRTQRAVQAEQSSKNRLTVTQKLKELEQRQKARKKVTLRLRLERAGFDILPQTFWIASAILGLACGAAAYFSMPTLPLAVPLAAAFVGTFGLPRWILFRLTKRRRNKFLNEFANAIDVIVRGVKTGLPVNECLVIIARESPEPIASEFRLLVEQQRVGVPLNECFDRMTARMPLAEVRFFSIVIAIQQQAGGNLSEALGNLAGVLRDRKRLHSKVKSLSAEAKASAFVLASLPFFVMGMVYLTAPGYITILWTTKSGQIMLAAAAIWMTSGVLIMRKMINFQY